MAKISVEESSVVERGSPMSSLRTPGSRLTFRFTVSLKIIWFSDVWIDKKEVSLCLSFFFLYCIYSGDYIGVNT